MLEAADQLRRGTVQATACEKRNRSHTQTHNKNNPTHDTTRTTQEHRNTRHHKKREHTCMYVYIYIRVNPSSTTRNNKTRRCT